jgi:glycosyltransferase involved in cell wall biosynthesis
LSGTLSQGIDLDRASRGVEPASIAWQGHIAVVGMSSGQPCGMRDHAEILAAALDDTGLSHSDHWLLREAGSLRGARAEVREWSRALKRELRECRPDAVLLHYSVFAYSYRGLPIFLGPVLATLHDSEIPLVGFMHELAFPWGLGGWRGNAWAFAHRARLIELVRVCDAVALTTDFRAQWLDSRPWLATRPFALAPVFSNLPEPAVVPSPDRERPLLGLFGYSYDRGAISLVLDTLGLLARAGIEPELALLGAPGRGSPLAETWLAAARHRGLARSLSFAGPLPAQQLSDALGACDVLLFADSAGPSSRKGTLAGSLASGRPLVATDGPRAFSELTSREAARVVEPTPEAVADAIATLLASARERDALGARGGEFAKHEMGVQRSVAAVLELLCKVAAPTRPRLP